MKIPFTTEQFLNVFKNYNEAVFPSQVMLYLLSFIAIYFALKPTSKSGSIVSGLLAFFWLWMGIVYHLIFFTEINKAAYIFGALFILQATLFLIFGVFRSKLIFKYHKDIYGLTAVILILFGLIIYPATGYFLGHKYPSSPTFGLPCPTTIMTFGFLLLIDKKCPVAILIIPVIWSVIGFTAAFKFGIFEDTALLISGLLTLTLILMKNRRQ